MTDESLARLVWRHVKSHMARTSTSWPTFAMTVREHYEALVPPAQRTVQFSQHRDLYTRARLDAQTLRRFDLESDERWEHDIPANFVDPFVLALRDLDYADYEALETEMAARRGRLSFAVPTFGGAATLRIGAAIMRESADAVEAVAELESSNGVIDARDQRDMLTRARTEVLQMLAAGMSALQQIDAALSEQDQRKV